MNNDSKKKPMAAIAPFGLRMQPELKERIEKAAAQNNRSMNAEIIARLEFALGFDATADAQGSEFAELVARKLDAQEAAVRETRREIADLKEWLRSRKPSVPNNASDDKK